MNVWTAILNTIGQDILAHLIAIGAGSGVLLFAFIHNMPVEPPSSVQAYWSWVRDSLQTAIPVRQGRATPTLPVEPAQPSKEK